MIRHFHFHNYRALVICNMQKKQAQSCKKAAKIKPNTPGVTRVKLDTSSPRGESQALLIAAMTSVTLPPNHLSTVSSQDSTMASTRRWQAVEQALDLSIDMSSNVGDDIPGGTTTPHTARVALISSIVVQLTGADLVIGVGERVAEGKGVGRKDAAEGKGVGRKDAAEGKGVGRKDAAEGKGVGRKDAAVGAVGGKV